MEILSVMLTNFKTHRKRQFSFNPGTNAICGENGAGKTSILEAIAWVLFNYRGTYRKDDLIRNGTRSAQVTVQFVSSLDQRTYDVQRCTSKGYVLFDPQLNQRLSYSRIDEEVLPWLRDHLGVAPGTDLARLFENTIGVPQGMLTADFLLSGEKRKRVFDAVLRVEEYKDTAKGLGSLQKYAEGKVAALDQDINHYTTTLADQPDLIARHAALQQQITTSREALAQLDQRLALLQQQKNQLDAQAQQVQTLGQDLRHLTQQAEAAARECELRQEAVQRSQQAIHICNQHRQGHQQYVEAEAQLKALRSQQQEQMTLIRQQQDLKQQQSVLEREWAMVEARVQRVVEAEQAIAALQSAVEQQGQLEQQRSTLDAQQQELQQWMMQKETLVHHLQQLRTGWKQQAQYVKHLESLEAAVAEIPALEAKRDRLMIQLSRVEVAQQFEAELHQIVAQAKTGQQQHKQTIQAVVKPLQTLMATSTETQVQSALTAAIAALEAGVALPRELSDQLDGILADLAGQVSVEQLQQQQQTLTQALNTAYQQRGEWHTLAEQRQRLTTIQTEGKRTQDQIDTLTEQIQQRGEVASQLAQVTQVLSDLNDPRKQCQLLEKDLGQKDEWLKRQQHLTRQQADAAAALDNLETKLAEFESLEAQIAACDGVCHTHRPAYLQYLQHQQGAAQLEDCVAAQQESDRCSAQLVAQRHQAQQAYDHACQAYDPEQRKAVEQDYATVRREGDQLRGSLPQQERLLAELSAQLKTLEEIVAKRDRAQADVKKAQQHLEFITFARSAYKQAGPRITERYVYAISQEADRLFRELLNRQNVALEWTRDYEIVVQEGPHQRKFNSLSGGEQMCAAVAVRLALLRVLADIDIAFFDEPTTNMDRPRRESLAEAISNLKTFRQLFVISHDDTFEQFTEHVVLVQREE